MPLKLTLDEKIEIVLIVGDNYKTYREAAVIFNNRHPNKNVHFSTISKIMKKFRRDGNVDNKFRKKHQSWIATEDIQNQIMLSAVENPKDSIRKRSATFGVSKDVVAKILKSNKFKPYKPQFIQTLRPEDCNERFGFCAGSKES